LYVLLDKPLIEIFGQITVFKELFFCSKNFPRSLANNNRNESPNYEYERKEEDERKRQRLLNRVRNI